MQADRGVSGTDRLTLVQCGHAVQLSAKVRHLKLGIGREPDLALGPIDVESSIWRRSRRPMWRCRISQMPLNVFVSDVDCRTLPPNRRVSAHVPPGALCRRHSSVRLTRLLRGCVTKSLQICPLSGQLLLLELIDAPQLLGVQHSRRTLRSEEHSLNSSHSELSRMPSSA